MTKQHIINKTALLTGQSKAQTTETINTAISLIKNVIVSGLTVSIQGFISLKPVIRRAIKGEIGGSKYDISERKGVKCKISKKFQDFVENGLQDEK